LKFPSHPVKFLKQAEHRHTRILTSDFDQILMTRQKIETVLSYTALTCEDLTAAWDRSEMSGLVLACAMRLYMARN